MILLVCQSHAIEIRTYPAVIELMANYRANQDAFKNAHRQMDQLKQFKTTTADIKREIRQMEEEKQSIAAKLARLEKRAESVPDHQRWLDVSRKLRIEQELDWDLAEK